MEYTEEKRYLKLDLKMEESKGKDLGKLNETIDKTLLLFLNLT